MWKVDSDTYKYPQFDSSEQLFIIVCIVFWHFDKNIAMIRNVRDSDTTFEMGMVSLVQETHSGKGAAKGDLSKKSLSDSRGGD